MVLDAMRIASAFQARPSRLLSLLFPLFEHVLLRVYVWVPLHEILHVVMYVQCKHNIIYVRHEKLSKRGIQKQD